MIAPWPVQQAIVARIKAIQDGLSVYDGEAPQGETGGHVVIGEGTGNPRNSFANRGSDCTETIHVWTPGNSSEPARERAEEVRAALEDAPLVVGGHDVALCRLEFSTLEKEPGWRHVVMRFRLHVREAT